jgi:hypothetical protein
MDEAIKQEQCDAFTSEDDSQQKHSSSQLPFVVACGHRRIYVPKTGNTFPAVCVCVWNDTSVTPILVWRSKRDFLCLVRSLATSDNFVKTRIQLPKAAFHHLTEEHVVPWIRPMQDIGRYNDASMITSVESVRSMMESFHERQKSFPNHYHVRMKKSIWQLDTFLQSAAKKVHGASHTIAVTRTTLISAWNRFCRPTEDSEGLVGLTMTDIPDVYMDETNPTITQKQSSRWGQYFASTENSQHVADVVTQYVLRKWKSKQHLVFVEPCCGHGDIVVALLERLKQHQIGTSSNVTIVGYDIDPQAVVSCQQRLARQSCGYDIQWINQDFLKSTRPNDLVSHRPTTIQPDLVDDSVLTVCLGGPPYSTGAGNNHAIRRDLPLLFVQRCQNYWHADCIAFLLPQRYRRIDGGDNHADWKCETLDLQSSTFYFQGKEKVTQPSILKTFIRIEKQEEENDGSN